MSLLKDTHKISYALAPELREEAIICQMLRSDQPADAEDSPGEVGSDCSLPWGHRHQWKPLRGAPSTLWTLVMQVLFWNTSSNLLIQDSVSPDPMVCSHHCWDASSQASISPSSHQAALRLPSRKPRPTLSGGNTIYQ